MSKAALKALRALIGKPVMIHWRDAAGCVETLEQASKMPTEDTVGFLEHIDGENLKLVLVMGKPDSGDGAGREDARATVPLGWVQTVTLLAATAEVYEIKTRIASVTRRRGAK